MLFAAPPPAAPTNDAKDLDAPIALLEIADIHLTTGRTLLADAQACDDRAARELLTSQARRRFEHAQRLLPPVLRGIDEQCSGFHRCFAPADDLRLQRGALLKGWRVRALTAQAEVFEGLAGTHPSDSPEARTNDEAAAEQYGLVYRDYRTLVAGLTARLKQGECYCRLGETDRAVEICDELLSLPDDLEPVRRLRVAAMGLMLKCRNSAPANQEQPAFSQGEEYLAHLPREEELWPEWDAVRLQTARGYLLAAGADNPTKSHVQIPAGVAADRAARLARGRELADKLTDRSGLPRGAIEELRNQIKASEIDKKETVGGNGSK